MPFSVPPHIYGACATHHYIYHSHHPPHLVSLPAMHAQWPPSQPYHPTRPHAMPSLTNTTDLTPTNRHTTFLIHEHHNLSTPISCAILCLRSATSTFVCLCPLLQPHYQYHQRPNVSPYILSTCVTQHCTNHYTKNLRPIHPPSLHVQWPYNPSHHHTQPAAMPSSSTTATFTPPIYHTILPTQQQQIMTFPAPCTILCLRNATPTSYWSHLPPHQLLPLIIRHCFIIGSTLAAICTFTHPPHQSSHSPHCSHFLEQQAAQLCLPSLPLSRTHAKPRFHHFSTSTNHGGSLLTAPLLHSLMPFSSF